MRHAKVAISIDREILQRVDRSVRDGKFASRSQAVQQAVEEKCERLDKIRLASECSKLNKKFERALADEGLTDEIEQWPEY